MTKIQLTRPVAWSYDCVPRGGTCKVDGSALSLLLRLEGYTDSPPDVLDVEAWFAEFSSSPLVVEELAVAASAKWAMTATALGRTATHGWLAARCGDSISHPVVPLEIPK